MHLPGVLEEEPGGGVLGACLPPGGILEGSAGRRCLVYLQIFWRCSGRRFLDFVSADFLVSLDVPSACLPLVWIISAAAVTVRSGIFRFSACRFLNTWITAVLPSPACLPPACCLPPALLLPYTVHPDLPAACRYTWSACLGFLPFCVLVSAVSACLPATLRVCLPAVRVSPAVTTIPACPVSADYRRLPGCSHHLGPLPRCSAASGSAPFSCLLLPATSRCRSATADF